MAIRALPRLTPADLRTGPGAPSSDRGRDLCERGLVLAIQEVEADACARSRPARASALFPVGSSWAVSRPSPTILAVLFMDLQGSRASRERSAFRAWLAASARGGEPRCCVSPAKASRCAPSRGGGCGRQIAADVPSMERSFPRCRVWCRCGWERGPREDCRAMAARVPCGGDEHAAEGLERSPASLPRR